MVMRPQNVCAINSDITKVLAITRHCVTMATLGVSQSRSGCSSRRVCQRMIVVMGQRLSPQFAARRRVFRVLSLECEPVTTICGRAGARRRKGRATREGRRLEIPELVIGHSPKLNARFDHLKPGSPDNVHAGYLGRIATAVAVQVRIRVHRGLLVR